MLTLQMRQRLRVASQKLRFGLNFQSHILQQTVSSSHWGTSDLYGADSTGLVAHHRVLRVYLYSPAMNVYIPGSTIRAWVDKIGGLAPPALQRVLWEAVSQVFLCCWLRRWLVPLQSEAPLLKPVPSHHLLAFTFQSIASMSLSPCSWSLMASGDLLLGLVPFRLAQLVRDERTCLLGTEAERGNIGARGRWCSLEGQC